VTVIGHDWEPSRLRLRGSDAGQVRALGIVEMPCRGWASWSRRWACAGRQLPVAHGIPVRPRSAELLIAGKEKPYLRWFLRAFRLRPRRHYRRRPGRVRRRHHPGRRAARRAGRLPGFLPNGRSGVSLAKTPLEIRCEPTRRSLPGRADPDLVQAVAPAAAAGSSSAAATGPPRSVRVVPASSASWPAADTTGRSVLSGAGIRLLPVATICRRGCRVARG